MRSREDRRGFAVDSPSQVQETPINRIVSTSDERGLVGAKKKSERGYFVRLGHAFDGLRAGQLIEHLLLATGIVLAQISIHEWRMHSRRRNTITANVIRQIVSGHRVRHRNHRALAHRICEAISES